MIRHGLVLVAALALVGCAAEQGSGPMANNSGGPNQSQMVASSNQGPSVAELAAFAGAHPYPGHLQPRNDLQAAAIVDPNAKVIRIYNFGTEPIRDANIWVNKAFVRRVNAIAPGSSIALHESSLFNAMGRQFADSGDHVNSVEVEHGGNLSTLWGPVVQAP